ncbi:DUF2935 domain-containing protein [Desulfallas thermosapovorans]|uniref:DUF2935 family protein n=1 Tax=Desulfallas thermosapovorans DSM 6562 TaxID=1121431 RepID=A0A5S4ZVA1_9FIRM|nr:DUF2935 domain-containing protein [Desulfallas thermosapovorans]TYO96852.1 protein of unknown function (DUF2935) [Desulfallas thermosapovorans DSM 6562]
MQYYYGDKNLLRVLDETGFWKQQEAEHTVVIRQVVPNLEPQYVQLLQEWERALAQTQAIAVQYIEAVIRSNYNINHALEQQIIQFIHYAVDQSRKFVEFLNELSANSAVIRNNPVAQVVINHIRRESEYYVGVVQAFLNLRN